jgi:DNA repair photolyase
MYIHTVFSGILQLMESDIPQGKKPVKGRGAISNPRNRFVDQHSEAIHDGWHASESGEDDRVLVRTMVLKETSRSIISTNQSPDVPFNKSINPYRGCEHGCIYCYARPTHAFWDLSPGLDFETRIIIKPGADRLLRDTLTQPGYRCEPICIGSNTDPYQPVEARLNTTRSLLSVLQEYQHPFSLITKSALIKRDIDILSAMAERNLCSVAVSVTTLDNDLKRILEPRTASGQARIETISALAAAGIPVTLLVAPMIPYINDHELVQILTAGSAAGAIAARYILIRLPLEVSEMFEEWLAVHFPDRAAKVMSVIRQTRGGDTYRSQFGERMRGTGAFADLLERQFTVAARKLGLLADDNRYGLDTTLFSYPNKQMSLL